jgi:nitroimidazol reductase NimA-like FMN-containing flavoprotein (pyridoxamine 5'-phosphate oxidase superfamily)
MTTITTLTREECEACLGSTSVGRIALAAGNNLHIIPVNYAAEGATIVFRTGPETILIDAPLRKVAFEVDCVQHRLRSGWSVCVHGSCREITGAVNPTSQHLRQLMVDCWAPEGRDRWFEIIPDTVTGRTLGSAAANWAGRVT